MTSLCLDQCIFVTGYRKCTGSPGCENPVWLVSTTIPRGMFMSLTVDIVSLSDTSSLLTIPQCSLWNAFESLFVICANRPQFQCSWHLSVLICYYLFVLRFFLFENLCFAFPASCQQSLTWGISNFGIAFFNHNICNLCRKNILLHEHFEENFVNCKTGLHVLCYVSVIFINS